MKRKTKIVIAGLSAAFALAATPVVVLMAEGALIADVMLTDMQKKFAEADTGPKIDNEEVERAIADYKKGMQTCLAEKSFPYLAVSEVFERWEGRLSFWPDASVAMAAASERAETKGFLKGLACIR
jgi:hypothetical protein